MFDHTRIKTSVQLIFIGILIVGIAFSCQTDSKHRVLKLAHGLDQSHSVHKAMVFMAERLKIRVMKNNTAVEMVKALGGSPTPISWGELYTALLYLSVAVLHK